MELKHHVSQQISYTKKQLNEYIETVKEDDLNAPIKEMEEKYGMSRSRLSQWLRNDLKDFSIKSLREIEQQVQTMLNHESSSRTLTTSSRQFNKCNDVQTIQYSKPENNLFVDMKKIDIIQNKHIPKLYLNNSVKVRQALLAGLIDTDGYLAKARYEIIQKNTRLSYDIVRLSRSLGYYTTWKEVQKTCTTTNATVST